VIRARIAPAALVIALAFVVIGFLRADREMTNAETDRAALMASETGTLVEAFLLRQLTQLQSIERVVAPHLRDSISLTSTLHDNLAVLSKLDAQFDHLLAIVPTQQGRAAIPLSKQRSSFVADSALLSRIVYHDESEPQDHRRSQRWPYQLVVGRSTSWTTWRVPHREVLCGLTDQVVGASQASYYGKHCRNIF
jgi:hypothetical protein